MRLRKGGIIFDAPERIPAVWGNGHDVLWSEGEPLIIGGPPGVGKTTIAQQVALARCGVGTGEVLGFPVAASSAPTLYVAADRPQQALRSMRRMVEPKQRERIDETLLIWPGPFPALDDYWLIQEIAKHGIGTVIFDSVKDIAGDVSDGRVGVEFNRMMQSLVAKGIEVAAIHHNRKGQEGNRRPRRLDDLYGSTWIAAGAGSVLYLYGEAGDREVELLHLKQPDSVVGPLRVIHDHTNGVSTIKGPDEDEREEFRRTCIEVLAAVGQPLGRDPLIEKVREEGLSGRNKTFREWLTSLAGDEESGLDSSPSGYVLTPRPQIRGQGGATPPIEPGPEAPSPPTGGSNGAAPGPPARATPASRPSNGEQMRTWQIDVASEDLR